MKMISPDGVKIQNIRGLKFDDIIIVRRYYDVIATIQRRFQYNDKH